MKSPAWISTATLLATFALTTFITRSTAADVAPGTTAVASSSRQDDPEAPAKAGSVHCMGLSDDIPMVVGDANAVLDGDRSTMWWSKTGGKQNITLDLVHSVKIHSIQIEWGEQFPSKYEIQWSPDGTDWKTMVRVDDFKNTFQGKSKTEWKSGWTYHKIDPLVTAKAVRIRCIDGTGDGYQIYDVYINESCPFSYEPVPADALYRNASAPIDERVRDILSRMTQREKIRLTAGQNVFYIPGYERFGLKPTLMCNTSAGIQIRKDLDWDYTPLKKTTAFPVASALAATWQPELAYAMGRAVGEECRAGGISILLGPGVNIHRSPTCGRNFEYFSEDPFLAAQMAVEQVKGIQSEGVIATVKHYLANNNEFLRTDSNAVIDERTLHEIYLPAFAAAIQKGGAKAIMSSYNWVNGEKCGESHTLLTDILRGELGYTGIVMSDWGGNEDITKLLGSGQNLMMPQQRNFGQYLREQWAKNPVDTEKQLDAMIAPTLRVLLETGIWNRTLETPGTVDYAAHQKLVREIGESAITLLKNDGMLPLQSGQKILLVGTGKAVKKSSSGGGSGFVQGFDPVNYLDGLQAIYGKSVTYSEKPSDEEVKAADRILYFLEMGDHEGMDRPFELPEKINEQIATLATKNPNLTVIASTGTSFGMPWLDKVKGLIHCYYLGQEYGASLANVLSGKITPSGKLPFTLEQSFKDSPAFGNNVVDGRTIWRSLPEKQKPHPYFNIPYKEGVYVGYRWYEAQKKPIHFPFGFGLSYTTFKISDLKVSSDILTKEKPITISATVTNTGKASGAEVVQLYVHENKPGVDRPYRELKGFQKVFLQPGESKTVTISLDWKALAFWDVTTHAWTAQPGTFALLVGNSSQDVQCQAQITYKAGP